MSRYYRDLEPDEPLQAGDEILADPPQWVPVNPSLFGLSPAARSLPEYRRPVDLPVLQRVTPEAMAELEGREAVGVLFVNGYDVQIASYNSRGWWWSGGMGGRVDRPTRGWFVDLSTIPEVQQ